MSLTHRIEVAVPEGTSKTEIGRIFEKFTTRAVAQLDPVSAVL